MGGPPSLIIGKEEEKKKHFVAYMIIFFIPCAALSVILAEVQRDSNFSSKEVNYYQVWH